MTPSFFATLDVQPMLGRGFTEAENVPGAPPVIVIRSPDSGARQLRGRFGRDWKADYLQR